MKKSRFSEYRDQCMKHANPVRVQGLARFFKTGKGEYGEGDRFLGLTVPAVRTIAKSFMDMPYEDLAKILASKWHEERLGAVIILAERCKKSKTPGERKDICRFYLNHVSGINNWDLVDVSAEYCVGMHVADLPAGAREVFLKKLLTSKNLWERRIGVVSTFYFSKNRISDIAVWAAQQVMHDEHDLIQKASGWMLREFGKRASEPALVKFLKTHAHIMPRTMLRYAIERLHPEQKDYFMKMRARMVNSQQ